MQFFKRYRFLLFTLIFFTFGNCVKTFAQLANKPTVATQVSAPTGQVRPTPSDYSSTSINLNHVRVWEPRSRFQDENQVLTADHVNVREVTQYFDGLGRPIQTVGRKQSPTGMDVVNIITYDEFGRENFKYLPYVQTITNNNTGLFKTNAFSEQNAFYLNNTDYAGEQVFYSRTEFEASPLSRPIASFAPGNSWAGSYNPLSPSTEKAVKVIYAINSEADQVRIWDIELNALSYDLTEDATINIPSSPGIYDEGSLHKSIAIDENGSAVVEYKDKSGNVLLKKVQNGSIASDFSGSAGFLSTYSIYDDLGRLRFVIPPKAVAAIQQNWSLSATIVKELCFRYEYDKRGRLIAKKLPGAGWVYLVYDVRDRVVFMQDANMRPLNQWMTTLYDGLNRPVMTGMTTFNGTPTSLQINVNSQTATPSGTINQTPLNLHLNEIGMTGGYYALLSIELNDGFESGASFSAEIVPGPGGVDGETMIIEGMAINKTPIPSGATFVALTKTFFDNYQWTSATYNTANNAKLDDGGNINAEMLPSQASLQTLGLVTGTKVRVIEDPTTLSTGAWLSSVSFFDENGRAVQSQLELYGGGSDILTQRYDFSGNPVSTYLVRTMSGQAPLSVKTSMKYDHAGRLLETWKTVNDLAITNNLLSKNEYDQIGQIKKRELGRKRNSNNVFIADPIETLDYSYNIQGWLKGINKAFANSTTDFDNTRWFGMELNYDWGFDQNQSNGNIGGLKWRSRGDSEKRSFGYSYDKANRLLEADFSQFKAGQYRDDDIVKFDVRMGDGTENSAYDENGNIKRMQQWGLQGTQSVLLDNLRYDYFANSNKLKAVSEEGAVANSKLGDFNDGHVNNSSNPNDYGYDKNGNLVTDLNKFIRSNSSNTGIDVSSEEGIRYNYLNLPWQITAKKDNSSSADKGTVTYIYDAIGIKRQKRVIETQAIMSYGPGNVSTDITTLTDYIGDATYETKIYSHSGLNSERGYIRRLQFISTEEGRLRPINGNTGDQTEITDVRYDFMIKDHLGNVRVVLTDERKVDVYPAATLEGDINGAGAPNAVNVEKDYYTIDPVRIVSTPAGVPSYTNENSALDNPNPGSNTTAASQKMYELKAANGVAATGLGITLKVMAGDRIDITGRSYWNSSPSVQDPNAAPAVLSLMAALLNAPTGAVSTSAHGGAAALSSNSHVSDPLNEFFDRPARNISGAPKASINCIFFDEQFRLDHGSFSVVKTSAGLKADDEHLADLQNLLARKNGYVYIYCSNQSEVSVFFDNLQVQHTRSAILEETHYYPFGLTMAGISSIASAFGQPGNKEKYNGNELQNEEFSDGTGLEWYDYGMRNYDAQIGRWHVVDPLANIVPDLTPYRYGYNSPVMYRDLFGLLEDWYETDDGEIIYDETIKNQDDLDKAGIAGTYLGESGYAIDESTGMYLYFSPTGDIQEFVPTLGGVTVSGSTAGRQPNPQPNWVSTSNLLAYAGGTQAIYEKTIFSRHKYLYKPTIGPNAGEWTSIFKTNKTGNYSRHVDGIPAEGFRVLKTSKTASRKYSLGKTVSKAGKVLGAVGIGATIYDGLENGWKNHHTADVVIGVATTFGPIGWIGGLTFLAADLITQGITGKSITENLFD